MGQKIKLGIIGCGRIAQAHLKAVKALEEEVELVSVVDTAVEKAKETYMKFGAQRYYLDYREALKDTGLEAVIITLPHHLHYSVTIDAAKAGKHILVEKPMALNIREADGMIEEAKKNKIILMVGQSRRFIDAVFEIHKRIKEIGDPFRIIVNFLVCFPTPPTDWWKKSEEAGGLVIPLQGSHSIDFILWLLNKVPQTVYATSYSRNPLWEGEDEADIIMTFDQGELATVHLSLNTSPAIHEFIIVGPKGVMRLYEYATGRSFEFAYRLDLNEKTILSGEQIPTSYTLQLKEFISAIKGRRIPLASGEEIRKVVLVLDAIKKSDREDRVVNLSY